jgi:hypothetical protein
MRDTNGTRLRSCGPWGLPVVATFLVLGAGEACTNQKPAIEVESRTSALTGPQQLSISLPNGLGLLGVGLSASDSLRIADRVTMTAPSAGFDSAINTGTVATDVGTDTHLINVISQSALTIHDRSALSGFAESASTVSLINGATAAGGTLQHTPITPLQVFSWTINVPASSGNIDLEPGQTRPALAPGSYGDVAVKSGAVLPLAAGTFFFNSLDVEPQAVLNVSAGPVFLYVATNLLLKGTINAGAQDARFFLGYLGTGQVSLESAFTGTIVAPNAMLRFAPISTGTFTGQFFARDVDVEPADILVLKPFLGWGTLFPLPEPTSSNVHPSVTCIAQQSSNTFLALFGYFNDALDSVRVRVGADNTFTTAPIGRGQVQRFYPGRSSAAFATTFNGTAMTWSTPGGSATASATGQAPSCGTTACSPACGSGESCVNGACVTVCGDGLCAGDEGCGSCPADCGCPAGMACFHNGCL